MERSEILEMMSSLELGGMRAAYDDIVTVGIKRQHSIEKIIGGLLAAQIATNNARSINYQIRVAKLPLAKELASLDFAGTQINAGLVEQLGRGAFLDDKRNVVLVGGTGTGKPTSPSALLAASSGLAGRRASSTSSISSTGSKPKPSKAVAAALLMALCALIC